MDQEFRCGYAVMSHAANPFRALASYKHEDHKLLFGRDGDLTLMVDRLMSRRATLLFAGSGVGKTSFLEAKLIPDLEDRYFICSHRKWAALSPLAAVEASLVEALRESSWGSKDAVLSMPPERPQFSLLDFYSSLDLFVRKQPCGSILILDQFEEVFQYHKDTDYFAAFIDELAEVINAPAPDVRVLFSMREEFLGELSVFDNKIPDLFNNYYRLKNPSKRQARDIITSTIRTVNVKPSENLSLLLRDLLSVDTACQLGSEPASGSRRLRDYVPPPYLQIVCYRLWRHTASVQNGDWRTFPDSYHKDDARHELELYCRETLDLLTTSEKDLICDALGFLMTSQGAKMAYELSNLAQHMDAQQEELCEALEQLSRTEVRILRQFTSPDGSIWFELYHDMYAPFLSAWKVEFQKIREAKKRADEAEKEKLRAKAERRAAEERKLRSEAETRAEEEKRQRDQAERAFAEEQMRRADENARAAKALAVEQQQRAEEKARAATWFKFLAAGLAVAFVSAVIGLLFAYHYWKLAYHYWKLAGSRELAADAIQKLNVDPELSTLLSLQALGIARTGEAEDSLHNAVESLPKLTLVTPDPKDPTKILRNPLRAVAYSPDGSRVITAGDDGAARVWDAASGQLLLTLTGHYGLIYSVAFSPDGKRLATASLDKTAKVWDASSGIELLTLSGHSSGVLSVTFSPDGRRLATGSADRTARLWDAASGHELQAFSGHSKTVYAVAFSPDGRRLATGSADQTAKLWDVGSGRELATFPDEDHTDSGHSDEVIGVAFSPGGERLATAGVDGTARVWDVALDPPAQDGILAELRHIPLRILSGATKEGTGKAAPVTGIAFSPTSLRIATTSKDGTVKVWDADSSELLCTFPAHSGEASAVAFDPHGVAVATVGHDGIARVWSIDSWGGEVFSATENVSSLEGIAFSPDGKNIATSGLDGVAEIRDNSGGELHRLVVGFHKAIPDVAFSEDGRLLATASVDKTVRVWEVASGRLLQTLMDTSKKQEEQSAFLSVAFSPDGTILAAGSNNGGMVLWDRLSHKEPTVLAAHEGPVTAVAFSRDGRRFSTASADGTAKVWETNSGKELVELLGHEGGVYGVAFSPDGKRLATGGRDGTAKVWDSESGSELITFRGHTDSVTAVAFTPDGQRLASSSWDNTVRLWDSKSGAELLTLSSPGSPVLKMAVSPDGKRLGAVNRDGALRVYEASLEDLAALAAKAIARPLTDQECKKYLHASRACSEEEATTALSSLEEGSRLAKAGDLDRAAAKLSEAKQKNHAFTFDPETEARELRASVFVVTGRNLAANGNKEAAFANFRKALDLDPALGFDPEDEARSLVAEGRVAEGKAMVRRGRVKEAIAAYKQAPEIDPSLVIDASSYNTLCWYGSLWGYYREVLPVCKKAHELAPDDANIGDSLGVALVLNGRVKNGLPYLLKFASTSTNKPHAQHRLAWLPDLESGKNPITPEEIEWLLLN
jgi:WD40 repeat protein